MPVDIGTLRDKKGFKVMCHNVRSLTDKKMVDFTRMLYNFDIGIVIESWYEPTDSDATLDVIYMVCSHL